MSFVNLADVEHLKFSNYDFDQEEIAELSKKLKNSRSLNMSNNFFSDKNWNLIFKGLQKSKKLEVLVLSETKLSSKGMKLLSETLHELPSLTTLDLSKNKSHQKSLEELFRVLKNNNILENLYLNDFFIKTKGSKLIGDYLSGADQKLTRLDISDNVNINGSYIFNSLKNNKTLKVLKVSNNSLQDSVDSLIDMVDKNHTLIQLTANDCSLNEYDIFLLFSALQKNPTLRILHLETNGMFQSNEEEEKYRELELNIGPFIYQNKTLKVLNLQGCSLHQENVISIFESLKENETLEVLNLSQMIGFNVFMKKNIFESLKYNHCLKSLYLTHFYFKNEILHDLLISLEENDTLEILNISCNGIPNESCPFISQFLSKNKKLVQLNLENNCINGFGLSVIIEGLSLNSTLVVFKMMGSGFYSSGFPIPKEELFDCFASTKNLEVFEAYSVNVEDILDMNSTSKEIKNCFNEMKSVQKISDVFFQFKYVAHKRSLEENQ